MSMRKQSPVLVVNDLGETPERLGDFANFKKGLAGRFSTVESEGYFNQYNPEHYGYMMRRPCKGASAIVALVAKQEFELGGWVSHAVAESIPMIMLVGQEVRLNDSLNRIEDSINNPRLRIIRHAGIQMPDTLEDAVDALTMVNIPTILDEVVREPAAVAV